MDDKHSLRGLNAANRWREQSRNSAVCGYVALGGATFQSIWGETFSQASVRPLSTCSGSFAAKSPRQPTSDNVRYVAFGSRNWLDIRANTESQPIFNVAQTDSSLIQMSEDQCSKFLRLTPFIWLAAERSEAAPGHP